MIKVLPIKDGYISSSPEFTRHLPYDIINNSVLVKTAPNHAKYFNMCWSNTSRYWHLKLIEHKKYTYIIKDFYGNDNGVIKE
jgi:hypothetical protein